MVEERRDVVSEEYVDQAPASDVVVERPRTVVEEPATRVVSEHPTTTYVRRQDPVANTMAASSLIQTLVWAAVVLIVLVVGILVLVHYSII